MLANSNQIKIEFWIFSVAFATFRINGKSLITSEGDCCAIHFDQNARLDVDASEHSGTISCDGCMHNYAIISSVHEGADDDWLVHMERSINHHHHHRRFGLHSGGCWVYFCLPFWCMRSILIISIEICAFVRRSQKASLRILTGSRHFCFSIFIFDFMPMCSTHASLVFPFIAAELSSLRFCRAAVVWCFHFMVS